MSHFVLQENSDGTVNLTKKKQVLAEVCGKVEYINQKNRKLFRIHAEKMNRKFRCVLCYDNPFLPVREGDAIFAIAEYVVDPQYGDTLNIIQPPFVVLGEDKNTVIKSFVASLKGTGFGTMKAHKLLDEIIIKTGSLNNAVTTLDRMASYYCYKKESDMGLIQPYTLILKENQMLRMLEWWYKNRNLRRLYLLGINNREIRNSKKSPEEMYKLCLDNPYKIFSLDINKCDDIADRLGKQFDATDRKCAEICRKLDECMESRGWTGVPTNILIKMFPDVPNYVEKLRNDYGIITELHTAYLPYPHEVEMGLTDIIHDMLDGPSLPHALHSSEITYTRPDLSENQKLVIQKALSDNICVIKGVAGGGKCLHPDTPILMFDGTIKKMMDTKVGELVMGPDSKPRTILSRCSGLDQMYRIIPSKGREFICNEPHVLTLKGISPYLVYEGYRKSPHIVKYSVSGLPKTKAFRTIKDAEKFRNELPEDIFDIPLNEYLKRDPKKQRYNYLFHIGTAFPEKEVPFDPYAIGMWLGDGTSAKTHITNIDKEVLDKLENIFNKYNLTLKPDATKITYSVVGLGDNYWIKGNNDFAKALRDLNLFNNKHIPDIYKINSVDVRLNILAGIIDADGYNAGNYYEITQKNKKLASDIEYLAFSLGFMVTSREVTKECMYKGEMKYGKYQRLFIMGEGIDKIPVVLERKKCYPRLAKNRATCLRFKVEPIGLSLYHGFELDGDGRFLLGDFTVTHNTTIIKELIHNLEANNIKYRVVSFTGKAVARIREVTEKKEPMTMHMSITMGSGKGKKVSEFSHLIIDEASMVTSDLMYDFIGRFGSYYRITLVGDPNQLMPIGWGTMFDQVIKSGVVPTYTLSRCFRVSGEGSGILSNANNIVECNEPDYNGPPFDFENSDDFNIIDGDVNTIKELIEILRDNGIDNSKITIICPYNKYLVEINKICQDIYNGTNRFAHDSSGRGWRINDRVMMTQNNYKINVMNGDEGTITDITPTQLQVTFKDGKSYPFLLDVSDVGDENDGAPKALTVNQIAHSFGVSVHRYQGSECDYVIFYIPQAKESKFLNRNLLYTGITRAKKMIWMVGDYDTMVKAATTAPAYRCDNLALRLKNRTVSLN